MEQKIKGDKIDIGGNIRRLRLEKGVGQTELVRMLQLEGVPMTREALVKIERGAQHIQASQLRAIRDALGTTYDDLLKQSAPRDAASGGEPNTTPPANAAASRRRGPHPRPSPTHVHCRPTGDEDGFAEFRALRRETNRIIL